MKSVSDSHLLPCGKAVVNHETPLFPPTLYVGKNDRRKCHNPSTSRNIYNWRRGSTDKAKFHRNNNQYVNGALYETIPGTCARVFPDNSHNSRILINVLHDEERWTPIRITKFHPSRLVEVNECVIPFHSAYESANSGKFM
jgi:hypothetical protein